MIIEGWNSGSAPSPDICKHIEAVCNALIVSGCIVTTEDHHMEIRCDKCRKVLGGRRVIP